MGQGDGSILITGGRGFVGRALAKVLRRTGYRVLSLDAAAASEPGDLVCDITDESARGRALESHEVGQIVHLAAILPTAAQRNPLRATRVNVDASFRLLDLAREFDVQRFVFGSSLSIYGSYPAEHVVSESDRAAPEDVYGAGKLYIEQIGAAYREKHGLDFVSLRTGRVVGPGAPSSTSAWRSEIFEYLSAHDPVEIQIPYPASERILVVHVDDVARMLALLVHAERPAHWIYNATCESVVVGDLKGEIERLNPRVRVRLGDAPSAGSPRRLDCSRFQQEFGFEAAPIFDRIREHLSD